MARGRCKGSDSDGLARNRANVPEVIGRRAGRPEQFAYGAEADEGRAPASAGSREAETSAPVPTCRRRTWRAAATGYPRRGDVPGWEPHADRHPAPVTRLRCRLPGGSAELQESAPSGDLRISAEPPMVSLPEGSSLPGVGLAVRRRRAAHATALGNHRRTPVGGDGCSCARGSIRWPGGQASQAAMRSRSYACFRANPLSSASLSWTAGAGSAKKSPSRNATRRPGSSRKQ